MILSRTTLLLLAFPLALIGLINVLFAGLALLFADGQMQAFLRPGLLYVALAMMVALLTGRSADFSRIKYRDTLFFATMTWLIMGVFGAAPIKTITGVGLADAVFESISGITTTGATILTGLDAMPPSLLLYRQFLQWLGGLGVVIFVVAVLPMLNVGGMRLLRAEMPGPMKDEKLSPRISQSAHYLWLIYVAMTCVCVLAYYFAGMSVFDAIAHGMTTVATGGFSTHDASMGYFDSHVILLIANVFMVLGAISFALHFNVWRNMKLFLYTRDEETRSFLLLLLGLSLVLFMVLLLLGGGNDGVLETASHTLFHLISFMTSTGYGATDYASWPQAVALILLVAAYLGGCAGSTSGGTKIIRNVITAKIILREFNRLVHPAGVFVIKFNRRTIDDAVINATMAFMFGTAAITVIFTILLMMTGLDFWSAFTGVAACVNVLGPAFGELGSNYQVVNDTGTWLLAFAMILGRLEFFTVLALLLPSFWRN